jgi:hypothetical protein
MKNQLSLTFTNDQYLLLFSLSVGTPGLHTWTDEEIQENEKIKVILVTATF